MTTLSQFYSPPLAILLVGAAHLILASIAEHEPPITLHGCPDKCGNISIPFPFGMKPGCFREGFEVTCNTSLHPPAAFLASNGSFQDMLRMSSLPDGPMDSAQSPIELIDISLGRSEARVYARVATCCYA
jgi:hypothetical protein